MGKEYTQVHAFADGFEQCRAQVRDMFNNTALDTRAKMKAHLESLLPFDGYQKFTDEDESDSGREEQPQRPDMGGSR